jgi:phosphoenolpyruvate carboxylase
MRKIPATMATQHPDNAHKPFWNESSFVSTADELKECVLCFDELGIDEYNWDWEGKFVDEAVTDRILHEYYEYFKTHPLGKEKFLTFRIPNPRVEQQFRLGRAFMVIVTSSQYARSVGFETSPIFEAILPLTESAEEIIDIQHAFSELVSIEHKLLKMQDSLQEIEIIPLFEQVSTIMKSGDMLRRYFSLYKDMYGRIPEYLRPYCARSDPALNSGLVPTMLALKVALSEYLQVEKETGVKLFPMVGTGSLPFRGGVSPETIDQTLESYAGVSTLTIQSAFRYDYPTEQVKLAIQKLEKSLQQTKATAMPAEDKMTIQKIIPYFETPYRTSIECIASTINTISTQLPRRRERVQHVGLFGYSRGIGKVSLPRAIPFTGSLYTLGIPPEFIGLGRGLKEAKKEGTIETVLKWYPYIKEDMTRAGYFLNKDNLATLAKQDTCWKDIQNDVKLAEEILDLEFAPKTDEQKEHYKIAAKVLKKLEKKQSVTEDIEQAGKLRHSLG